MTISLQAHPVRARLRAITDDIHQALHGAAPFAAIAAGTLDRPGYGALLSFLHRYHQEMAAVCRQGARYLKAPELAAAHRARLAALEEDLNFLGQPVPPVFAAPEKEGAFAAGCLYTVQGSTLGGKVINRQLDYLLPDARGRTFFGGSKDDAGPWRLLCDRLEETDGGPELEQGALFAFRRFDALLNAP